MSLVVIDSYRFASGGSGLSPDDPYVWYDASDTSTITHSSGNVTNLSDKGSAGATLNAAGTVRTGDSTLNGKNILDFDGSGDYLSHGGASSVFKRLHDGTSYHMFMVVKPHTSSNPTTLHILVGNQSASSAKIGFYLAYEDRTGNNDVVQHTVSTGGGSGAFAVNNKSGDGALTPNAFHIIDVAADPDHGTAASRSSIRVDNGTAITNNSSTTTPSTSNPSDAFQVGASGGGTFNIRGSFAELIIYDRALTGSERTSVYNYLSARWGL